MLGARGGGVEVWLFFHSKASKQARLVERKVCFISDAGNWRREGGGRLLSKANSPTPDKAAGENVYKQRWGSGGTPRRNSTVISHSHLQIGHQWSDQHDLDHFECRKASVPGSLCSHFFAVSSQNCGLLCPGYSLMVMFWYL